MKNIAKENLSSSFSSTTPVSVLPADFTSQDFVLQLLLLYIDMRERSIRPFNFGTSVLQSIYYYNLEVFCAALYKSSVNYIKIQIGIFCITLPTVLNTYLRVKQSQLFQGEGSTGEVNIN